MHGRRGAPRRGRLRAPRPRAAGRSRARSCCAWPDEDEDGAPVRRRVALAELDGDRDDDVAACSTCSPTSRLITVGDGTVEVAHEALLREWPRLRGWLEEDARGSAPASPADPTRRATGPGRPRSGRPLPRRAGSRSALEWRAEHEPELNAAEQQFLDASRAAERARAAPRAARARAACSRCSSSPLVAALLALDERDRARAQARAAEAQRLGAQALSEHALDRSLLLARQGVALDDAPATRDNLLAALRRSPAAIGVMRGDGDAPRPRSRCTRTAARSPSADDRRHGRLPRRPHAAAARPAAPERARVAAISVARLQPRRHAPRERRHRTRTAASSTCSTGAPAATSPGWTPDDPLCEPVRDRDASRPTRGCSRRRPGPCDASPEPNRLLRWDARTGRRLGDVRRDPGALVRPARVTSAPAAARHVQRRRSRHRHPRRRHAARRCASSPSPARSPP